MLEIIDLPNIELIKHASKILPCLIIDCANCANPHRLFPDISLEDMQHVYVIEVELIYSFRDVIARIPELVRKTRAKLVTITSFHHLINYQDDEENSDILEHAYELLIEHAKKHDIMITKDCMEKLCSMQKRKKKICPI